ncbi:YiaA/YiaB family protein [Oscillochloris sp. ZM17-4]|uniref:inner membrane protein YiaA n=1 Tax=Oscillochloris sp. ZM17-4 TaxID=2866714 RepID=UPI001C72EEDB|nr:inner membrane protein YiaA [Oscillochloris sp. ZM17-4]MBX0328973.1 YiaA/YiaB family protein [Oscillochloris sp. ZM17-4]
MSTIPQKPSSAFVLASWAALLAGITAYLVGLWNAGMPLSEKGYYFTVLMYGLFAAVSLQKSVRDHLEGVPVTPIYFGLSWSSVALTITLLAVGLWNASLLLSEKGFYAMAFVLAMFAAVTVQKNTRDLAISGGEASEPGERFRWPTPSSTTATD